LRQVQRLITLFAEAARFELLDSAIATCPYAPITGLLLGILKDQISKAWPQLAPPHTSDSSNSGVHSPASPFLSHQALSSALTAITHARQAASGLSQQVEVLLAAANLLRFLWLKSSSGGAADEPKPASGSTAVPALIYDPTGLYTRKAAVLQDYLLPLAEEMKAELSQLTASLEEQEPKADNAHRSVPQQQTVQPSTSARIESGSIPMDGAGLNALRLLLFRMDMAYHVIERLIELMRAVA